MLLYKKKLQNRLLQYITVSLPNRGKTSFQVITVSYLLKYRMANVLEILKFRTLISYFTISIPSRRQNIFWLVLDSEL